MNFDASAYLRDCIHLTAGANGLWIKMLCIMDLSSERGFFIVPGGRPTYRTMAEAVAMDEATFKCHFQELRGHGVFSIDDRGFPFSRRMVREQKRGESIKNAAARYQATPPGMLQLWIEWWNDLVKRKIVLGAVDPKRPNMDVCRAWIRVEKDGEQRNLLNIHDLVDVEKKIVDGGDFLKSWLTLAGLLAGRNGNGESKFRKLMDGFYSQQGGRQVAKRNTQTEYSERMGRMFGGGMQ